MKCSGRTLACCPRNSTLLFPPRLCASARVSNSVCGFSPCASTAADQCGRELDDLVAEGDEEAVIGGGFHDCAAGEGSEGRED
jgi:hypothetical protein